MQFKAHRALAAHCPELLKHRMKPADRSDDYRRLNRRLSTLLPAVFAPFYGDADISARAKEMEIGAPDDLLTIGEVPMMHFLLKTLSTSTEILVSMDQIAIFEMVDRAFGGDGKASSPLPTKIPRSAEMILERLEVAFAELLARIAPGNTLKGLVPMKRETDITMLRGFYDAEHLRKANFTFSAFGGQPWSLCLTMEPETLDAICEDDTSGKRRTPSDESTGATERALEEIPFEAVATLIDMKIPIARLSGLKPGDLIPVSVARSVPLSVGGKVIAHGSVGELDDRVALKITSAF